MPRHTFRKISGSGKDAMYPEKRSGHRRPLAWPPWSSDHTPLDFLRGNLKEHVCIVLPMSTEELTARLMSLAAGGVTTVNAGMFWHIHENTIRCTAVCLEMHGAYFKYLL